MFLCLACSINRLCAASSRSITKRFFSKELFYLCTYVQIKALLTSLPVKFFSEKTLQLRSEFPLPKCDRPQRKGCGEIVQSRNGEVRERLNRAVPKCDSVLLAS